MKYIEVIEELANSKNLHKGNIKEFSSEILMKAAKVMSCRRTNAWLFNHDKSILNCINCYDLVKNKFSEESPLRERDLPNYFSHLTQNKIIISDDALTLDMNKELVDTYLIPHRIKSMIDVPIRSQGKMVGVICFECVDEPYQWTNSDQKFTQSLAQLFSLALETNEKRVYRSALEKTVKQKEVLLYEINHRVKNNMSVIIGLINLQKQKVKDEYHYNLLEELNEKMYSMAVVQNHLHNDKSLVQIELSNYLEEVINNLYDSYSQGKNIALELELQTVIINISIGIPIGLMANEILTNSFKYAFDDSDRNNLLQVKLKNLGDQICLIFKDNGPAYNPRNVKEGMGLELIRDLCNQIGGELNIKINDGVEVEVLCPIKVED